MGKAGSKISNITNSNASAKGFNPEFEYRTKNLKQMKEAYKTLKRNLLTAMTNMEATPQRLKEVGTGYFSLAGCVNYSGGGSATRRDMNTSAELTNNASGEVPEGDAAKPPSSPPARMDRELADESFQASKKFCEAMETLSTSVYPKYRNTMQAKVANEIDGMIALNGRVMEQSRKTVDAMAKYVSARKTVTDREKANTKKGKDVLLDQGYAKLVADRDTKEKAYQAELNHFDDQYEDMMAQAQNFVSESTEVFLDSVVGYYHDMVETIDYTETPSRSKTHRRSGANNNDGDLDAGSREPTYNTSPSSPEVPVKTV